MIFDDHDVTATGITRRLRLTAAVVLSGDVH
jgi:hypothetical protein